MIQPSRFFLNPRARSAEGAREPGLFTIDEYAQVDAFFRARHDVAPTPLHDLPGLAARLGLGGILIKDESSRLGLNAFKGVGVLYAVNRMLESGLIPPTATLVCATQGNHGRAVAHVARRLGLQSRVYVPSGAVAARIDALRAEGANVVRAAGGYDDAVATMRTEAASNGWVIVSDTAWPGHEEVPRWIMAGYTRLLEEVADRLHGDRPDIVIAQAGVGGLACAVSSWLRYRYGDRQPYLIVCEPLAAACLMETARAGTAVAVREGETIMTGLCAGQVSSTVWRVILSIADGFVAIDDTWAERAIAQLAQPLARDSRVIAGASGAAGLGALLAILEEQALEAMRVHAGVDGRTKVLLINTEGTTDPSLLDRILGAAS
ncbi:MAG: diaminopropionate ammonia-lyase [Acidobacteria bacterium]|nr:diaminopropionate ammonia-lyase [Acidobacteriota bacterium]